MPNKLADIIETLCDALTVAVDELREEAPAGAGEAEDKVCAARNGVKDDDMVTLRSGDLREVVDAYRKLVRFARNGKIPTQDERMSGHEAVKAVKHLIRKPIR